MYSVTFYSYKGGVGRTLALANVASEIVARGESVFLLDFDLEAPGLQTFDFLSNQSKDGTAGDDRLGLTDLVLQYFNNPDDGIPDLEKFVSIGDSAMTQTVEDSVNSLITDSAQLGKIWFLSAGTKEAFEKIRWRELYAEKDGFIFFEGLKRELKDKYACDWLLIDSRTGRAETTGICTRQLSDTNVLLFFPNEQNRISCKTP